MSSSLQHSTRAVANRHAIAPGLALRFDLGGGPSAQCRKTLRSTQATLCDSKRKDLHPMDKSIAEVVAESLRWHMDRAGLNAKTLGALAKVSDRTVGNFLYPKKRQESASGKEPSGKLTELAMIASALKVPVSELVSPKQHAIGVAESTPEYGDWPLPGVTRQQFFEVLSIEQRWEIIGFAKGVLNTALMSAERERAAKLDSSKRLVA